MSLRKNFLTITIILLLLTNAIAFFTGRYFFTNFIKERFGYVNKKNTEMVARQIELVLNSYQNLTCGLAYGNIYFVSKESTSKDSAFSQLLEKFLKTHTIVSGIRVYHPQETIFEIYQSISETHSSENLFKNAKDSVFFSQIHVSEATQDTIITIAVPIQQQDITKAVLAIDYKMSDIYHLLKLQQGFGKTDEAYLVNQNGFMVSPSRFKEKTFLKQKTHLISNVKESKNIRLKNLPDVYTNYLDYEVFSNSIIIPRLHSTLFNEISLEEAYRPVNIVSHILSWIFFLLFVVVILDISIAVRWIIKPIKLLRKSVRQIEKGKLDVKIKLNSKDEIGDLARSFEQMREKINKTELKLKKHSDELESQVNQRTVELDEKIELLQLQKSESLKMAGQLEEINSSLQDEINEHEKTEKALKESEMRYRIVSDISSDYAYALKVELDGSLRNLWMTGAFEKMTGYSRDEITERGGWEFLIHPEDTAVALQQVGVYLSGMPSASEYRIINKSGEIYWVRDNGRPEWNAEEQRVKYIYGAIKDITLQKEVEDELKKSEMSYRELFDSNSDAIYIQDIKGVFVTVNKGAEKMYGYPKDFFVGKTPEFISAPGMNDLKKVENAVKTAFKGTPQRFEFWGKRKNGQVFPKEVHLHKGTYFGKEVIIAYALDISDRKAAEKQVQRLSQAVEQSPISILILDKNFKIEYANEHFKEITGYFDEDILKKEPVDFIANKEKKDIFNDIHLNVNNGLVWRGEILNRFKDGQTYWEDTTISPIYDKAGKISNFIAFKKDITENKKLEEQFRQSQKMEAIGRLAGGVAHDFNNLLTVIIGYSELILSQIAEEDALFNKIKQIDKAGRRAEALTRQLLAFSRKQIIQPKIINLNQMIIDMEKMLKRLIGEHIELQTILSDDLGNFKADPGQIEQVIMNLCINARDAMPDGGTLLVSSVNIQIDNEQETECSEMKPGPYIKLTISDTGIGMDENLKDQIFEPFFTTKEKGKGTGLGLSTVYGIIKQSDGAICVDSKIGQGTTFKMLFPRSGDGDEAELDAHIQVSDLKGTETIFVVEDEDALRALTVESLEQAGYKVLSAEDGEEAISTCINFNDDIHLLLTDVVMPKMGGRKLAEEMVKIHPEINIIYMSGYTDDSIVQHGVLEGNTEFIAKPFKPTALLHKIRRVLDQTALA